MTVTSNLLSFEKEIAKESIVHLFDFLFNFDSI